MGVEQPIKTNEAGKRRAKRARVLLSAKLETESGSIDCRLRDLSPKGALIECKPTPPIGSEVRFVRGTLSIAARVAWSQPGRLGLEFAESIDEADIMVQLKPNAVQPVAMPMTSYGPEGYKQLNARNRKLAQAWGIQVGINLPDEGL